MAKKLDKNVFVGLDIGTSKVAAVIGEVNPLNELEIIGVGSCPSKGLRKGMVVNMEATINALQRAIEEAESVTQAYFNHVFASISGAHIRSFNSEGVVAIREQEVSLGDVERVTEAAKAVLLPVDEKILHILPQEYSIDNQKGIHDPLGMGGVRLETRVHIIASSVVATQNLVKCIAKCGLEAEELTLSALASAEAVLTEDEKQLGVCLVDIGGGTTDVIIYLEGTVRHTLVLPIAGDQITNDLAVALRIPSATAEQVKKQYGCANRQLVEENDMVDVTLHNERHSRKVSRKHIAEIIEPRLEELLGLIQAEFEAHQVAGIARTGMVLTGGSSQLSGMLELAEEVFKTPVRLGVPMSMDGATADLHSPIYATALGLLLKGVAKHASQHHSPPASGFKDLFRRAASWLRNF